MTGDKTAPSADIMKSGGANKPQILKILRAAIKPFSGRANPRPGVARPVFNRGKRIPRRFIFDFYPAMY